MDITNIKALTFDTGGTILDWHTGFSTAMAKAGKRHGVERNWSELTNELRRRSLALVVNQGKDEPPKYTFDDAHRIGLESVLKDNDLDMFTREDIHAISYEASHNFNCWPDFPDVLPRLREKFMVASFTLLSYRLIMDTAKKNGLLWDAVFSCEGIGKYKILPEAYQTTAKYLQLEVSECLMVACHNFDLDAAKAVGFKTAFVRRPDEWGPAGPPDPNPNPHHDLVVDTFPELATVLGVKI